MQSFVGKATNTGRKQNMFLLQHIESFEWICLSEAPESNDNIQTWPVHTGDLIVQAGVQRCVSCAVGKAQGPAGCVLSSDLEPSTSCRL